MFVIILKVKKV